MNRRESLETQKKDLEEKISEVTTQMSVLDPASTEYKNLKRRNNLYFSELDEIESQLSEFSESSLTSNKRGNVFDKKLRSIDFEKPKKTINEILNKFGRDGVSAFFLIENIGSNRGDLLIQEIHHSLSDTDNTTLHYYISLLDNHIKNKEALLDEIAKFSKAEKDINLDNYSRNIIDSIEGHSQPGSSIIFELGYWDALGECQDSLLSWFIESFWIPLTEKHYLISQKYANVKILIFLTTGSYLSKTMKNLLCNQKIVKLSLPKKWKCQHITHWIEDTYKYSRQHSIEASKIIFDLSKGDPDKTCHFLERRFNKIA
ncbi:hypothetical protein [Nodularia spumigena]|nr:hypothetical protein [Nodularia spumigena]MDB9322902.1 hypothetical protein [Nodularia spumigena CS-591/07A]MDB9363142.1 hypothetical protein [Nodularia spumigena CS-588/02A10]